MLSKDTPGSYAAAELSETEAVLDQAAPSTLSPRTRSVYRLSLAAVGFLLAAALIGLVSDKHEAIQSRAQPQEVLNAVACGPSGTPSFAPVPKGTCDSFKDKTDNCAGDYAGRVCGACFNAGSRAGAKCRGSHPGYSCPPDKKDKDGDMAFACMDWTFGSTAMIAAESSYNCRSGQRPVYFGVGTYGVDLGKDPMGGLGQCVQIHVEGVDHEIIAQSINTGHDVAVNQFDLQMGAGGVGIFNTCAGDEDSMYPGPKSVWGKQYGGLAGKSQCANLPKYPRNSGPMKAAGDSLVALCEYAFDKGVYQNPSIRSITRVACPAELVNLTQFRRADEPSELVAKRRLVEVAARRASGEHGCKLGAPGATADYCLTRMMDCRKPSGAIKDNLQNVDLLAAGHRLIQPCLADGYTRIDVQCGCHDCYC